MTAASFPVRRDPPPRVAGTTRLRQLDETSRTRALSIEESRELERLLHADYCRRLRMGAPIPRGAFR